MATQNPKAETAANKPTAKATEALLGLEIIAKVDVFYRAKREWTQVPKVVAKADLTTAEIEELQSEPMLIVREVELPKPAAEATTA